MFTCRTCGHPDMAHNLWAGACLHGSVLKPTDPDDQGPCECPAMN